MFDKILIANRGEIALRVIRACRALGVPSVAVHSEADADALHVRFADEAICIGPAAASESYLNVPRIIAAAEISGADAVHPGYGFLAENAEFAEICAESGLTFVGPSPEVIRRMGDKAEARRVMAEAGVPVVPGSHEPLEKERRAVSLARSIGYPVMLKAVAGGGGRGMRMARSDEEFRRHFGPARREAEQAFGDGRLYVERYLESARHVEFQILGDRHGRVLHLGERDCSIQRRHQKLVEESPSPGLDASLRERMGTAAVRGAQRVGYVGAGTVECLVDPTGAFYFMEMNTRIQVEHPVTEEVTGFDIVREQIRIAAGEPLHIPDKPIRLRGHAIEFRINAEDPARGFLPSPGRIVTFHVPGGPGVRVDTHAYAGYTIPPHYDSLIAKLICRGADRDEALGRARAALDEFVVEGIRTTIPFHQALLRDRRFLAGAVDTRFLESFTPDTATGLLLAGAAGS
ncbi:MAG: acetyl-CoA carboxylase biotin carboxylase subunit [Gemmatimonadetes bacterium]|nr:acetyl-CoA carboxylase biotin carboxylase subunit [Gemmatimonadota bacterium]